MGVLRDTDIGERAQFLTIAVRLAPLVAVVLAAIQIRMYAADRLGGLALFCLLVLDLPAGLAVSWLLWRAIGLAAGGLVRSVYAGGDIPHPRGFSAEDALVMQGRLDEAVLAYERHIASEPDDVEARLRLAELELRERKDDAAAERAWLAARQRPLTPAQETLVSNSLIDLYQRTGRDDRLKVELARFAAKHPGTRAGAAAAERLRQLKRGGEPT